MYTHCTVSEQLVICRVISWTGLLAIVSSSCQGLTVLTRSCNKSVSGARKYILSIYVFEQFKQPHNRCATKS